MNNQILRKNKSTFDKVKDWLTIIIFISQIYTILASFLDFSESSYFINTVLPYFLLALVVLGIGIFLYSGVILPIYYKVKYKEKREDFQRIQRDYDEDVRNTIEYEELDKEAKKLKDILPLSLDPEILGICTFYWYIGLEFSIWKIITKDAIYQLPDEEEEEDFNWALYLCKFKKSNTDKRIIHILGSEYISDYFAKKIHLTAAENIKWKNIFKELENNDWKSVILCSQWKGNKFLRKYGYIKENILLIYLIEIIDKKCDLFKEEEIDKLNL